VTLTERNPAMIALLRDAHRRALADAMLADAATRIEIVQADALALLRGERCWDAIYLDPMYPDDGKTALPGKEMQILRDLTGGDPDADALLTLALEHARRRVVVKRAAHAPCLGGREPSTRLKTTQLRFDVYLTSAT
jgi:16S rRNA (guanine1516-N2)-methyltransferase